MGPFGRALAARGAPSGLDLDTVTFLDIWNRWVVDHGIMEVVGPPGRADRTGRPYTRLHCAFGGKNPVLAEGEEPDLILVNYDPAARMMLFCNTLGDWLGDRKIVVWGEYPRPVCWTEQRGATTMHCSQVLARLSAYRAEELNKSWDCCEVCSKPVWNCSCAYDIYLPDSARRAGENKL